MKILAYICSILLGMWAVLILLKDGVPMLEILVVAILFVGSFELFRTYEV